MAPGCSLALQANDSGGSGESQRAESVGKYTVTHVVLGSLETRWGLQKKRRACEHKQTKLI